MYIDKSFLGQNYKFDILYTEIRPLKCSQFLQMLPETKFTCTRTGIQSVHSGVVLLISTVLVEETKHIALMMNGKA